LNFLPAFLRAKLLTFPFAFHLLWFLLGAESAKSCAKFPATLFSPSDSAAKKANEKRARSFQFGNRKTRETDLFSQ